jgi:TRAP-type mannitol/chloroaromatic compound transport system permease small subunit
VRRLLRLLDGVSEGVGQGIAWLTLLTVLATFGVVVLRYAFGIGATALQEAVLYLHASVFLAGAAFTLRHEGHVRVDILYRRFSPRVQAGVELAGTLLLLLPVCAFILWVSWEYVAQSWALRESSRDSGGLPWVYLLKSLILLMAGLLLVQGLAEGLRALLFLRGELPALKQEHPPIGEEL